MDYTKQIIRWYETNRRDLPWRRTDNPYYIWLSEVILQQTRVDQGMAYYLQFLQQYPTIKSLAEAPEQEVLKLWQGLGYYSRARNLHFASRQLMSEFGGVFPETYQAIRTLKGVGDYTAAAIASIAFNEAVPVVDGNVKRVISRIFGLEETGRKLYDHAKEVMQELLDPERPGDFNQAVMEFGAIQCMPKNPDCNACIFKDNCRAFLEYKVDELPAREIKKKPRNRYFSYFVIRDDDTLVFRKRTADDIWKNLYEFPLIESSSEQNPNNLLEEPEFNSWFGTGASISGIEKEYKHQLSHQTIHARYYIIENINPKPFPVEWQVVSLDDIGNLPMSRLMERFLEEENL